MIMKFHTFNGCEIILKNKVLMLHFDIVDITIQRNQITNIKMKTKIIRTYYFDLSKRSTLIKHDIVHF